MQVNMSLKLFLLGIVTYLHASPYVCEINDANTIQAVRLCYPKKDDYPSGRIQLCLKNSSGLELCYKNRYIFDESDSGVVQIGNQICSSLIPIENFGYWQAMNDSFVLNPIQSNDLEFRIQAASGISESQMPWVSTKSCTRKKHIQFPKFNASRRDSVFLFDSLPSMRSHPETILNLSHWELFVEDSSHQYFIHYLEKGLPSEMVSLVGISGDPKFAQLPYGTEDRKKRVLRASAKVLFYTIFDGLVVAIVLQK